MRIIGDNLLAFMRDLNEANLPHTAIVEAPIKSNRGGGSFRVTGWQEITSTPCRLQPVVKAYRTVEEVVVADAIREIDYWLVITAYDFNAPIPEAHRFRIEGEGWEVILGILGATGPHTHDAMRKWVCKSWLG